MKAFARLIVRCHPKPWRARYEEEMLALLAANPVRVRDLFDLFKSGVTERVLSWYEPSWHIARFRLITCLVIIACVAAVLAAMAAATAGPWAAGRAVDARFGPLPQSVYEVAEWLQVLLYVVVYFFWFQLFRVRMGRGNPPESRRPLDLRLFWSAVVAAMFISFLSGATPDNSSPPSWSFGFVPLILLLDALDPSEIRWPGGDLLNALGRHRQAQYDLRWARMELTRCEGLYVGREAGPELRAARGELERLLGEEARAVADLDAMGYHARFQT